MKSLVKHILTYCAALMIIAATGGISLFQHYCGCHDEQQNSLFTESVQCHIEDESVCCEKDMPEFSDQCCSAEPASNEKAHHDHTGHDCCSTVYTYYKTDQVNLKKPVKTPEKVYSSYIVLFDFLNAEQEIVGTSFKCWDTQPPTTMAGRDLLDFIQQRKLDVPPC